MRLRFWVAAILTPLAACTPLTVDDTLPPDSGASSDGSFDAGATGSDAALDAGTGDVMADTITQPDVVSEDGNDGSEDGIGPCYGLDAGFTTLYVSAQAPLGGSGVRGCPLRTITSALAIAPPGTTILVAAGTYDAALGEAFPLVVRGVTISGAPGATTIIRGRGSCPQLNGSIGACDVAMLVGDTTALTSISNLTLEFPSAAAGDYFAMLCDRGNAPAAPGAHETPNTVVFAVNVHADFTGGIVATTAPSPIDSACNLSVTGSSLQGGHFGIWGVGDVDNHVRPAIEVGDGTLQGGVSFSGQHEGSGSGAGVRIWDEVGRLIVRRSSFHAADEGIDMAQHPEYSPWQNHFEITDNEFLSLTTNGVAVGHAAVVDLLSNNTFSGISSGGAGSRATAVLIDGADEASPFFSAVRVARNNSFIGNDVAIEFRGMRALDAQSTQSDFGTSGDPGGNIFRCNAGTLSTIGADVLIGVSASGAAITIPFVGNAWDHAPPTTTSSAVNGNDISRTATGAPNVDASGATVATATCPSGRTP